MCPDCPELERFLRGEIAATAFPHREHVRMAFEMLRRCDFAESVWLFSKTLRMMAIRADKPQAFHQTITLAFLSLMPSAWNKAGRQISARSRAHTSKYSTRTCWRVGIRASDSRPKSRGASSSCRHQDTRAAAHRPQNFQECQLQHTDSTTASAAVPAAAVLR